MSHAADITPGYTFASGEANVTHTKLNNAASGTIATTFYSGKSSAGSSPTPANYTMIGLDSVSGTYKRATLDAWFFDHSGLLADRTVLTAPSAAYTLFVNDGGAYKQISITNLFYGGTSLTVPTNQTRLGGVLQDGTIGSMTLSNFYGSLAAHTLPTNGDFFPLITENGRGVKGMTLESLFKSQTAGTNFNGDHLLVSWDGTRLRGNRATNFIDGITTTNSTPSTNDAFAMLQDGALKKLFLSELRTFINRSAVNLTQSVYSVTTNIAGSSGNWSNVVDLGTSSLSASITPQSNAVTAQVLVRLVLQAGSAGSSDNGYVRVLRGGNAIGTGADDAANRVEAGGSIPNLTDAGAAVYEFLDTTGPTNTTYTVQVQAPSGNTIYINRDSSDANSTANGRFISTLTLTEIKQ